MDSIGITFTHNLIRAADIIAQLKVAAAFRGCEASKISDMRYPTVRVGSMSVRFCIIHGIDFQCGNNPISRADVEDAFRIKGIRFCDAAEALLPVARDHKLGSGGHPYLAFITGTRDAFIVSESGRMRSLHLRRHSERGRWSARYAFVGVCE